MKHIVSPIETIVHAALLVSECWAASYLMWIAMRKPRFALYRKTMAVVVFDRTLVELWNEAND